MTDTDRPKIFDDEQLGAIEASARQLAASNESTNLVRAMAREELVLVQMIHDSRLKIADDELDAALEHAREIVARGTDNEVAEHLARALVRVSNELGDARVRLGHVFTDIGVENARKRALAVVEENKTTPATSQHKTCNDLSEDVLNLVATVRAQMLDADALEDAHSLANNVLDGTADERFFKALANRILAVGRVPNGTKKPEVSESPRESQYRRELEDIKKAAKRVLRECHAPSAGECVDKLVREVERLRTENVVVEHLTGYLRDFFADEFVENSPISQTCELLEWAQKGRELEKLHGSETERLAREKAEELHARLISFGCVGTTVFECIERSALKCLRDYSNTRNFMDAQEDESLEVVVRRLADERDAANVEKGAALNFEKQHGALALKRSMSLHNIARTLGMSRQTQDEQEADEHFSNVERAVRVLKTQNDAALLFMHSLDFIPRETNLTDAVHLLDLKRKKYATLYESELLARTKAEDTSAERLTELARVADALGVSPHTNAGGDFDLKKMKIAEHARDYAEHARENRFAYDSLRQELRRVITNLIAEPEHDADDARLLALLRSGIAEALVCKAPEHAEAMRALASVVAQFTNRNMSVHTRSLDLNVGFALTKAQLLEEGERRIGALLKNALGAGPDFWGNLTTFICEATRLRKDLAACLNCGPSDYELLRAVALLRLNFFEATTSSTLSGVHARLERVESEVFGDEE